MDEMSALCFMALFLSLGDGCEPQQSTDSICPTPTTLAAQQRLRPGGLPIGHGCVTAAAVIAEARWRTAPDLIETPHSFGSELAVRAYA